MIHQETIISSLSQIHCLRDMNEMIIDEKQWVAYILIQSLKTI